MVPAASSCWVTPGRISPQESQAVPGCCVHPPTPELPSEPECALTDDLPLFTLIRKRGRCVVSAARGPDSRLHPRRAAFRLAPDRRQARLWPPLQSLGWRTLHKRGINVHCDRGFTGVTAGGNERRGHGHHPSTHMVRGALKEKGPP